MSQSPDKIDSFSKSAASPGSIKDVKKVGKTLFLLSRKFPPKYSHDMKIAARTYVSRDLQLSTLLEDSVSIFGLNYVPNRLYINSSNVEVEDLHDVPDGSYLYVKYDPDLQFSMKRVRLFRNSYPKKDGKIYHIKKGGIDKLLKDAKQLLKLDEYPRYLFLGNGKEITDINSLPNDMTTDVIVCIDKNCVFQANNDDSISVPQSASDESQLIIQSNDIYNYMIGMSSSSVKKVKAYAKFAAFQMLSDDERRNHPEAQQIRKAMKNAYTNAFNGQLVSQMMIPPKADYSLMDDIVLKSIKILSKSNLGKFQFVISGSNGSGKTTFLYAFANTFVKKLTLTNEVFNYLMFPINFEKYQLLKDSPLALYNLFIEIAFDSLKYTCFDSMQFAPLLKQYLLQLPLQSLTINAKKAPINFTSLQNFANDVVKCFQNNGTNIANLLCKFPPLFAKAMGLVNAVFIIDHFDCFGQEFCSVFAKSFQKTPYIVATKNDKEFFEVFNKSAPDFIYTENLVTPSEERILSIPELKLQLTASNCFGSPGFISSFIELCNDIENFNVYSENSQIFRGKFNTVKSRAELSRKYLIRQRLYKLCIQLESAGSKVVSSSMLNILDDSEQNLTFNITQKNPSKSVSRVSSSNRIDNKSNSAQSNQSKEAKIPNSNAKSPVSQPSKLQENLSNAKSAIYQQQKLHEDTSFAAEVNHSSPLKNTDYPLKQSKPSSIPVKNNSPTKPNGNKLTKSKESPSQTNIKSAVYNNPKLSANSSFVDDKIYSSPLKTDSKSPSPLLSNQKSNQTNIQRRRSDFSSDSNESDSGFNFDQVKAKKGEPIQKPPKNQNVFNSPSNKTVPKHESGSLRNSPPPPPPKPASFRNSFDSDSDSDKDPIRRPKKVSTPQRDSPVKQPSTRNSPNTKVNKGNTPPISKLNFDSDDDDEDDFKLPPKSKFESSDDDDDAFLEQQRRKMAHNFEDSD